MDCSKVFLIIVNVIFLIFGFGILISGIVFKVGFDVIKDALVSQGEHLDFNLKYAGEAFSVMVIVFGCFIILIAGLGCLGACCNCRVLLGIYSVIVGVILIAEIAAVGVTLAKGSEAEEVMSKGLMDAMNGYHDAISNKTSKDRAFDAIFSTFQCCGVNSYKDFGNLSKPVDWDPRNPEKQIPVTCCKGVDYEHVEETTFNNADVKDCLALTPPMSKYSNSDGCFDELKSFVSKYKYAAIGVGVTIFLIELIVCILAMRMCCKGKRDEYV